MKRNFFEGNLIYLDLIGSVKIISEGQIPIVVK